MALRGVGRAGGSRLGGPPVEAVLLDALGTLVSLEPPAPALRRVLADRHGVELTAEQAERAIAAEIRFYRSHIGEGRDLSSVALLRGRCADALREALAAERLLDGIAAGELTEALLASLVFRPFDEVPDVLARLRGAGLRLVVTSNWDASLPDTLEAVGLRELVDDVVTSAEVGAPKPDPRIFEAALAAAGVTAPRAVHVGDSVDEDLGGARAAGIRAVLVDRATGRAAGGVARGGAAGGEAGGAAAGGAPVIGSLDRLPDLLGLTP